MKTYTPLCQRCLDYYCSIDFFKGKLEYSVSHVNEDKKEAKCKICGKKTKLVAVNFKKQPQITQIKPDKI